MSEVSLGIACWHEGADGSRVAVSRHWLSSAEWERLDRISDQPSRRYFGGGRWLLKSLLAPTLGLDQADWHRMHIESRDGLNRGKQPRLYIDGQLQPVHLSLSHTNDRLAAAVCWDHTLQPGLDVVDLQPLNAAMAGCWLTDREQQVLDPIGQTLIWSAKEALFKTQVLGMGVGFSPQAIDTADYLDKQDVVSALRHLRRGEPHLAAGGQRVCWYWYPISGCAITLAARHAVGTIDSPLRVVLRRFRQAELASTNLHPPALVLAS